MPGWELHDGQRGTPPHDEDHVLRMIAAGLPAETMIRAAGTEEWKSLRSHAPFAMALERRAHAQPVQRAAAPARGGNPYTVIGVGIAGVAVLVAIVLVVSAGKSSPSAVAPTPEPTREPRVPAPPPAPPSPAVVIASKKTAGEAFKVAAPLMVDAFNDSSPGTALFTVWALRNLRWSDVAVTTDETSFAKIRKDVDAERGKRLCVGGSIVQIEATKTDVGTTYAGLLVTDATNLYHFWAVKSSGELVQHSPARFCGYVTGAYDYSNSGGGTGHAVDVVGMFDLPENRK